jgi:hypothetical protein
MQFALFSHVSDLRSLLHTGLVAGKTQSLAGRSGNRIFWEGDFSCRLDRPTQPLVQGTPGISLVVKGAGGVVHHTTTF